MSFKSNRKNNSIKKKKSINNVNKKTTKNKASNSNNKHKIIKKNIDISKAPPPFPQAIHIEYIHSNKEYYYDCSKQGYDYEAKRIAADSIHYMNKNAPIVYEFDDTSNLYTSYYRVKSMDDTTLIFESRFESGNLLKAVKVDEYEYDLYMRPDINTRDFTQWFYFSVSNTRVNQNYRFNIVNMLKSDSMFNYGLQPVVYSDLQAQRDGIGWYHSGHDIIYYKNSRELDQHYYTLSFCLTFKYYKDRVYIAYSYPYSYTNLRQDLEAITTHPIMKKYIKQEILCKTLAGNVCDVLTITDFDSNDNNGNNDYLSKPKSKEEMINKPYVILMARVHPGESVASLIMKGIINYLCSDSIKAKQVRKKYIFKIIPMLNPDGVIMGNYRCSLAGVDLNRQWKDPGKRTHPTIYAAKELIRGITNDIDLVVDIHGHSRKECVFMYGCESNSRKRIKMTERIFPFIMWDGGNNIFSYQHSHFMMRKSKACTARIVLFKELGIANSYTLESTFAGADFGKLNKAHFTIKDYYDIGKRLCTTLLKYNDEEYRNNVLKILQLPGNPSVPLMDPDDDENDSSDGDDPIFTKQSLMKSSSSTSLSKTKKKTIVRIPSMLNQKNISKSNKLLSNVQQKMFEGKLSTLNYNVNDINFNNDDILDSVYTRKNLLDTEDKLIKATSMENITIDSLNIKNTKSKPINLNEKSNLLTLKSKPKVNRIHSSPAVRSDSISDNPAISIKRKQFVNHRIKSSPLTRPNNIKERSINTSIRPKVLKRRSATNKQDNNNQFNDSLMIISSLNRVKL